MSHKVLFLILILAFSFERVQSSDFCEKLTNSGQVDVTINNDTAFQQLFTLGVNVPTWIYSMEHNGYFKQKAHTTQKLRLNPRANTIAQLVVSLTGKYATNMKVTVRATMPTKQAFEINVQLTKDEQSKTIDATLALQTEKTE